jgi:hypothetical protein
MLYVVSELFDQNVDSLFHVEGGSFATKICGVTREALIFYSIV